ncbi:RdgB/HAM1 family non-canonical purine NTP pyrophosphatase, partial [bacterium]|nr:RdgB/HAM1 family non-canonical purine NTP pyrophosphatase [bacterium]
MALLLASNNPGKLRELHALLPGAAIATPAEIKLALDVAETGTTFAANAALKARAFAKASGHITLADDSGLEVDALNGAPGVYSARYGGPGLDDEGRYRRLLDELEPFPQSTQRSARFRCAIFACAPDGRHCLTEGTCEGQIAHKPAGDHGFGYDPVFYVPAQKATMAQLPPEVKNTLSHRAQ